MKYKLLILFNLLLLSSVSFSQEEYYLPAMVVNGDTIGVLTLPECNIEEELNSRLKRLKEHNEKLIRYVSFVMPYAKYAAAKLKEINMNAAKLKTEAERKKYYVAEEKKLRDQFENDLQEMSFNQGKLLIKLIDRETGKTTYKIIQEYRSTVMAVFWQSFARIFGYNLKQRYNPEKEKEREEIILLLGYN